MTSAYGASSSLGVSERIAQFEKLSYIPLRNHVLKDGTKVDVDFLQTQKDVQSAMNMLNSVIEEGQSWPFETPLTREEFSNYFLSHSAFVVRLAGTSDVAGVFYCKPNFPGRSGHFCNGGFITRPEFRRRGVGRLMATVFIRAARDLGYKAILFNLVYKSNVSSMRLWKSLGFSVIGTLPKVGRLKFENDEYVDADQCYLDLTKKNAVKCRSLLSTAWLKCVGAVIVGYLLGRSCRL